MHFFKYWETPTKLHTLATLVGLVQSTIVYPFVRSILNGFSSNLNPTYTNHYVRNSHFFIFNSCFLLKVPNHYAKC
jgi:hypothetical protein